ncbi:phospholipase C, phosphocholine-specific [Paraflavitalea sp. CAU 1676]|uniref:phosphocholine-specific phospholipase C n=1 Tax=Paraflavitalea sp. CAU 1676 TaxID=3032598 RepID=UPI0023DC8945|nr:phospholipase C, phosphocholine-specific [Paraflavitalea sp. CAU 1676]MDF2188224.1 phospholipase C, phosphocholine-specific [Paraflavitalea sp. CAU 1676]
METRRSFLKKASLLSGGAGMLQVLPASIARAMAINPAPGSTWRDAEHVVFLMQENRSFDHTYGSLQGVRGFNDPRAITLPNKNKVWLQTNAAGETYAPFHLDIRNTKATWMNSLPHSWSNQVDARNDGKYDGWLQAKRSGNQDYKKMPLTMGYHNRHDIPFYYALADAFTVCDQNFCSSLTGTTPNRLYFWSGTIREKPDQNVLARVWNGDADYGNWANWTTFPERLEDQNVSWKVYQNEISVGVGFEGEEDAWLANFTDNPLEFFSQYHVKLAAGYINNLPKDAEKLKAAISKQEEELSKLVAGSEQAAKAQKRLDGLRRRLTENLEDQKNFTLEKYGQLSAREKALHEKAFTTNRHDPDYHKLATLKYKDGDTDREVQLPKGDILHQFRSDVNEGKLPTVSWIVAPENFSDHPGAAWYGAWYLSEVMDILTKNPEVWKKTILVLTYDENDGYFDHVPPFVAPNPKDKQSGLTTPGIDTGVEYVTKAQQSSGANEMRESPIGLGYRVPLVIASPWSRGGWVNSQVFDHTSALQFLEQFLSHKLGKPVTEPNISSWRRTVCGDLTSIFRPYDGENFSTPAPIERDPFIESIHKAKFKPLPSNFYKLSAEEVAQANTNPLKAAYMPHQEKGIRNANALPYELYAECRLSTDRQTLELEFTAGNGLLKNAVGSPFLVYTPESYQGKTMLSRNYAVAAGKSLADRWRIAEFDQDHYFLQVYGPNGFFRQFKGNGKEGAPAIKATYQASPAAKGQLANKLILELHNDTKAAQTIEIKDNAYKQAAKTVVLKGGQRNVVSLDLATSHGWYDITITVKGLADFESRYAGRVETGRNSKTDPLMGGILQKGTERPIPPDLK